MSELVNGAVVENGKVLNATGMQGVNVDGSMVAGVGVEKHEGDMKFPIVVEMADGGKKKLVKKAEDLPFDVAFKVVMTDVEV